MSDDGAAFVAFLVIVMVFVVGFWSGRLTARGAVMSVVKTVEGSTAPTPALRCSNGGSPTTWTREEAESRYHAAAMHLRTAESAGLWNDRGKRALGLATAMLLEVSVCQ